MAASFKKTMYNWTQRPKIDLNKSYGIYVNIPFCESFCSFCPFYKAKYSPQLLDEYLPVISQEIAMQNLPAPPQWIYFGGGTPNILSLEQLKRIVDAIKTKTDFNSAGIELMPKLTSLEYLKGLKELGFQKVSLGVESFNSQVSRRVKRDPSNVPDISKILDWTKDLGLFANIDLMVGLQAQKAESFLLDLKMILPSAPEQITMYPYMVVRGFNIAPEIPESQQFDLIEEAWGILESAGYQRISPWTFSRASGEYDCSKAELVNDYIGFGAGSFSTNGKWKVVNPPVEYYNSYFGSEDKKALVAPKESAADQWRLFGRMLADLEIENRSELGSFINSYIHWLRITGYIKKRHLTPKGMILAHHLMKTIVENLPFPLQDMRQVSNSDEFQRETSEAFACNETSLGDVIHSGSRVG